MCSALILGLHVSFSDCMERSERASVLYVKDGGPKEIIDSRLTKPGWSTGEGASVNNIIRRR
jgi:hypothetical protein